MLKRNFYNRRWVWLGFTRWGFDESRLTESGRKTIEDNVKGFGLDMKIGKQHYMESVENPFGIEFIAEKPHTILENVMDLSAPWENRCSYASVLFDEQDKKYKMWYSCLLYKEDYNLTLADGSKYLPTTATLYAESDDGINWIKPELNNVFYNGKPTNFITPDFIPDAVFIDPKQQDGFKFKSLMAIVNWVEEIPVEKRFRLEIIGSKNGTDWEFLNSEPLYRFFDTQNIVNYDKLLDKYVGYFRHHHVGRSISRAEADDILKMPLPDCLMSPTITEALDSDYYTNGFTFHPYDPEVRFFFSSIFHHSTDSCDIRLGVSTDGHFFEWVSHEPIIDTFTADGKQYLTNYAYPSLLPLKDNVGLLFSRHEGGHDQDWDERVYGDVKRESIYSMALWNADRIVGIKAENTGEFHTDLKINQGKMQINFRTLSPKGYVKVEVLNNFVPVKNFTLADSDIMTGDCNWTDCSWNGEKDLSLLENNECKIRIHLENAIVYGIRVIAEENAEVNTKQTFNAL